MVLLVLRSSYRKIVAARNKFTYSTLQLVILCIEYLHHIQLLMCNDSLCDGRARVCVFYMKLLNRYEFLVLLALNAVA